MLGKRGGVRANYEVGCGDYLSIISAKFVCPLCMRIFFCFCWEGGWRRWAVGWPCSFEQLIYIYTYTYNIHARMQADRCRELPICPLFISSSLDATVFLAHQTKTDSFFGARSHGHSARSRGRTFLTWCQRACFEGSRMSCSVGITDNVSFFCAIWQKKITSRDGCFLPKHVVL